MTGEPRPDAHLARLHEILGTDTLIEVLLQCGGAEVYIADRPTKANPLFRVVGASSYSEIARIKHLLPTRMPTGKKWIARVWHSRGISVAQIARNLHMSDVSVRRWVKPSTGPARDDRQASLF